MSFVAAIRRVPGGSYLKAPKSLRFPAVPVETTVDNLRTYFDPWPKCQAQFLLYGPRRPCCTAMTRDRIPSRALQKTPPGALVGIGRRGCAGSAGPEHLYGPGGPAAPPRGGGAAAPTAEAAAAAAAAAGRSLGLAGVLRRFRRGEKLAMITAYDFPSARLARGAGVDIVLVGDSIGNCRLGLPDTVGVTMEDIVRATTSARRGIDAAVLSGAPRVEPKPVLVGDMPFGSFLMESDGLRNAAALRMAGAEVIKLEGGRSVVPLVRQMTTAGIPVMGHIGLQPQSAALQGGLRMQGTTADAAQQLVRDARELAEAGAVLLVLECVPAEVAGAVQRAIPEVPVIGIGAGGQVAGQVLVCDDLLGLHGSAPSFVKQYADLAGDILAAYSSYAGDVRSGDFPGERYGKKMKQEELEKLRALAPGLMESLAAEPCEMDALHGVVPPGIAPTGWSSAMPTPMRTGKVAPTTVLPEVNGHFAPLKKSNASVVQARLLSKVTPASAAGRAASTVAGTEVQVLRSRDEVEVWRRSVGRVAFVPTMGNLHEGHLELVDEAKRKASNVLVSIFVNPAQFAAHEDLDTYPRTFQRDLDLLKERGVAAVFAPTPDLMYPRGSPGGTVVVPRFVEGKSEDACRPHFFTGVATVVLKLFNIVQPDVAIFGQKDAMQCSVIRRMLEDLCLDSRISMIVAPTSREPDGLARSSRNAYLTTGMRRRAPAIYAALSSATAVSSAPAGQVRAAIRKAIEDEGMHVSYVSVADGGDMEERADEATIADTVVSVACLLEDGDVQCRLIDNVVVPAQ